MSLWFALTGAVGMPLAPDPRDFHGVRWWDAAQIRSTSADRFDPHIARALHCLDL